MKFRIVSETDIVTPNGTVSLNPGRIIKLDRNEAIPMIEAGVITPIAKVAYRLYCETLGAFLWVVPDESCALVLLDVTDPIYTLGELKRLKGLSMEGLRAVHLVKTEFENSRIESVAHAQGEHETNVPGFGL
jgi:hypothetical protein